MGEELGEQLRQEHFSRGKPLIIERDGVTMLKHPDGRVTPVDGEYGASATRPPGIYRHWRAKRGGKVHVHRRLGGQGLPVR